MPIRVKTLQPIFFFFFQRKNSHISAITKRDEIIFTFLTGDAKNKVMGSYRKLCNYEIAEFVTVLEVGYFKLKIRNVSRIFTTCNDRKPRFSIHTDKFDVIWHFKLVK